MRFYNELAETISLDGTWQFSLEPEGPVGTIQTPGCWEAQGCSKYAEGPARYRRGVSIPAAWAGQRILLEFDAVSYACKVFCNGTQVGEHTGLWTPFAIDLTGAARCGAENLLELVIYKPGERYPMRGSLAGFLPDVATTFGGVWQSARLRALRCGLSGVKIEADYAARSVTLRGQAESFGADLAGGAWQVEIRRDGQVVAAQEQAYRPDCPLALDLPLPDAALWRPERPALYTVTLRLAIAGQPVAAVTRRVGFRRLSADGSRLLLNGEPFMARGVLSWGWDPERIAPCYTPDQARAEMRQAREMGFNLIKLCLFVPNPAYFDVADEEGMLLWEELPMWLPEVDDRLRAQAPQEYAEIADLTACHPAVALYSLGCELSQSVDDHLLGQLNQAVRERARDVLLCDNSGSGESYGGLDFDFADFTDYHPYYDLHYFEPLLDNWRRDWQPARPWIFGEFCDSDTFRDVHEMIRANGGQPPWWMTPQNPVTTWRGEAQALLAWKDRLAEARPGFLMDDIVKVSYQQSYVIRKYTLEALRRRRGIGGYVITGLRDTPISTSGVWDDLGRPKWSGEDFRQINGEAVLSLDVGRRRTWRNGGDRPDPLDGYNYWSGDAARWYVILNAAGEAFTAGTRLEWTLSGERGEALASSSSRLERDVTPGAPAQVGTIECHLPVGQRAAQLQLAVTLNQAGRKVRNHWPVWVYPRDDTPPQGLGLIDPTGVLGGDDWLKPVPRLGAGDDLAAYPVLISTVLDSRHWQYIENGGRVLLLQQGDSPLPVRRCPFWREAVKLFPAHPLWQAFPQRGYTDMQFFGMASDLAFDTTRLPGALPAAAEVRPILRRLDAREFTISEYLFEARVGRGMLLACALRLDGGAGAQPSGGRRNIAGAAMLRALTHTLVAAQRPER